LLKPQHTDALILGTGGASKAVAFVLEKLGIRYTYVSSSRINKQTVSYDAVNEELIRRNKMIINTTPLGMYPGISQAPSIPYEAITDHHLLYDLIYNPGETEFLKRGRMAGAQTKNGLDMLYLQAEKSWQIWNSH
jgi:shikimate dehydrogenase